MWQVARCQNANPSLNSWQLELRNPGKKGGKMLCRGKECIPERNISLGAGRVGDELLQRSQVAAKASESIIAVEVNFP
jgi:hypothetical protein